MYSTTCVATTTTAIHALPVEILLTIFLHVLSDDAAASARQLTPAIVVASHVCSRWRAIALSHGRCWASVDICARRWAKLFLRRAGSLDLALAARGRLTDEQLELFAPHLVRAKTFTLCGTGNEKVGDVRPDLVAGLLSPASMPILESLQLENQPQYDYHADAPPSLRHLVLRDGCYISSSFPILHANLVHLELARCLPAETGVDIVHSVLRGLPGLQHLVLNYAQKLDVPPASAARMQPVALPNLQTLDIRDTPTALAYRMDLLQIPREAHISVASDDPLTISTISAVATLARALNEHAPSASHALAIAAPAPATCMGRISLSYQVGYSGREPARLELATGTGHAPLPCVLRKLLCTVPTRVHTLQVNHGHFFAVSAWADLHHLVPAVERISVAGQTGVANGLMQSLLVNAYPSLQEIVFTDIALGGRAGVDVVALAAVRATRSALGVQVQGCTLRSELPALVRGALVCSDARPGHAFRWSGHINTRAH